MSRRQRITGPFVNAYRFTNSSSRVAFSNVIGTRRSKVFKPAITSVEPKAIIRYAYYLFVFSLPFEGAVGGLFLLGLLLAGSTLCQPRLFFKPPPKAFWCFVIYLAVAAVFGLFGILDAPQDSELRSAILSQLLRFCQLLVFFLIAYRLMIFESIEKRALLTFAVSCVLVALLDASGVITTEVGQGRMTTFEDNPNRVASVLGVGLISLVGLAYGRKDMTIKVRLLAWLTSGFLLIAMVRTGARGNLLALIMAVIVLTVRPAAIAERMKTVLIAIVVIASLAVASYQIDAVRQRWEKTYYEGDVAGRQVLLPAAWEMFLEKPLFGWGPITHSYEMAVRTRKAVGDPHNLYLWILIETGILGAIPFFLGVWLCWRSAWRARDGVQGSLPLALVFFLLAINLKGTYLMFKLFWVVLAYALASSSYALASSKNCLQKFPIIAKTYTRRPCWRSKVM
jgi:O-antigen ligase